jgi:hypothetical protein
MNPLGADPELFSIAITTLGAYLPALSHVASYLRMEVPAVRVRHVARLHTLTHAETQILLGDLTILEEGFPETSPGANDAVVGFMLFPTPFDPGPLLQPLLDFVEGCAGRIASRDTVTAQAAAAEAIAEAVRASQPSSGSTSVRARMLDATVCAAQFARGYAIGGLAQPELKCYQPGDRALSNAMHCLAAHDTAGVRTPVLPHHSEYSFLEIHSAERKPM